MAKIKILSKGAECGGALDIYQVLHGKYSGNGMLFELVSNDKDVSLEDSSCCFDTYCDWSEDKISALAKISESKETTMEIFVDDSSVLTHCLIRNGVIEENEASYYTTFIFSKEFYKSIDAFVKANRLERFAFSEDKLVNIDGALCFSTLGPIAFNI